uniref:Mediator of RNA polymerase II transcription subunit 26 n=1 Tax=Dermatophagoides pteronyssinus TaxID=6956 RepID=A0A6P6YGX8_DERPT|nr:putative mediator of RNA polymerase II transcription subunit 26 [Dermatophagoides pteronyssinus]
MKMYQFRIVITLFVLAIYWPSGSYGFFWPLTALFGSKSASTAPVNNGELPEIILRPYVASDSNDLNQLSSPLSSPSSSNFFGSDVSSSSLQTQQFPQQQQQQQTQSNYGYFNMDGSTSVYSGSNSHQQQQQQQLEQTYQSQQQIEQIPLEQSPVHSIISNEQQPQQQQQSQEPAAISSYFFNPANLFDSKRFSYINRFKHQRQPQQPMSTSSTTKYVSSPNIDQNQYLIIPKPSASSNVEQQMPSQDNSQPQPLSTNNVQQQQQSQQTVPQQKHSANNWVYVSPVNKLNSQQQPILLEAYFQDPSIQQQFQQNYQVGSIKGLIGKTGKQRTSATANGNSVKMPLLSWLSIPSPNQIHLPLQWFKAKSTQQQNVDNQMNIDEQQQSQPQHYYSSTIQHQKPLYGYTSPSSSNYFTQSVISNGNSVGSKQPSPQAQQVQVQSSNQQQSMANGGSVWSSPAEASSSNRLLTGTLHSPQQSSALQFWVETDRQPGRVIFPKPTITTTGQYSPQQPYQTIQDYQPIRTGSSQAAVSQVEPNQDLGGWDSIQMADIVKPGQHQSLLQQQQQENGETMDSNIIETMMPSASSDQSVVMNETVPANQQQQQQQQARETITGQQQQQQQSHRVVYQQQNSSQSINSTTPLPLPTTPTSNSRALYNHHPQFQSIYQMIQQSQQQQQQQQQENSASQT